DVALARLVVTAIVEPGERRVLGELVGIERRRRGEPFAGFAQDQTPANERLATHRPSSSSESPKRRAISPTSASRASPRVTSTSERGASRSIAPRCTEWSASTLSAIEWRSRGGK